MGGILFFVSTLLTLRLTDAGIQNTDIYYSFANSAVLLSILKTSVWIGVLAGVLTSIALRKSENRRIYVWIVLIFILIFTEYVISTIY